MLVTVRKTKLTDGEEFNLYHNPTAFILTGAVGGSWTLDPTQDGKKSAIETAIARLR
jgi:hypothetical protein